MPEAPTLPTIDRLLELIDRMAGQPVLVVADLVADRFITGVPKRISREAPVLILRFESEVLLPGGGANAIANLASLGGEPLPLGAVGDDEIGERLLAALAERGVATDGIVRRPGYRTPTKTRVLGGGRHGIKQQIVRYDVEERLALDAADRERFAAALERWAGRPRAAVLSDYGYGAVEPDIVPAVRRTLADGAALLGDSRFRLGEFRGLDAATPNEEEAEELLGESLGDEDSRLIAGGWRLRERLGLRFLLVTLGSRGMALFSGDRAALVPVHGTDQVADVTGAGDTVIGTFALALAAGASAIEAALLANFAGGIVVMRMGTATLTRAELAAAVSADLDFLPGVRWARS